MNRFGKIFSVQIFGESHGNAVGIVIDGCPPGIEITPEIFKEDITRRKGLNQQGTTPRKEDDIPKIISGVFNNHSTGTPITILFENNNTRSADYEKQRDIPRPGHADWVANKKYNGYEDFRGGGHFSARVTTGLVAAGVIAKKIISPMQVAAKVIEIGGDKNIENGLQKAIEKKDSVGAIVECRVKNMIVGLGEPYFNSLESMLSHIIFAIPAVKGIEFGSGFQAATMFGVEHNDAILNDEGKTKTNYAGGIVGGISNGNDLVFNVAFKPTASTPKEQESWNWTSKEMEKFSIKGRHDLCVALRAPVIVEAATAIVLADMMMIDKMYKN